MKKMETTLLLLFANNQILLARKKRGFGVGKYNGVGGKLEKNETPEQAMIREAKEEIDVVPIQYEKRGIITFLEYVNEEQTLLTFHLYVATSWEGIPKETEEMQPAWFSLDAIPYENMFSDDQYWLPFILENKKIKAFFSFDENWNLQEKRIEEVDTLNF